MVFEDGLVVVHDGEVGAGLDVEVVGGAGVVEVVDDRREEESEDLKVRKPGLGRKRSLQLSCDPISRIGI